MTPLVYPTGTPFVRPCDLGLLELPAAFDGPRVGYQTVFVNDELRIQIARGAAVRRDNLDAVANPGRRILRH